MTRTRPGAFPVTTRGVSLTTKIFLGTALVVAAVLGATLAVTARQAGKTADDAVNKALADARSQINTQLDERRSALMGQAEVFVKNPDFRAIVEQKKLGDVLDQSQEAVTQIGATWVQITSDKGVRLAKSNEAGADTVDLSGSALIGGALEGSSKGGYGVEPNALLQTVAVPILGTSRVVGVLMAVRTLDSTFAASLKSAGGAGVDIVLFSTDTAGTAHLVASTIGRSADLDGVVGGLKAVPPMEPGRVDSLSREVTMTMTPKINGTNFVALGEPLRSAAGSQVGGFIVLRNRDAEFAAFIRLRNIILGGGAIGLLIAGLLSFGIARQITRPVMQLVDATRRAADGDYSADIDVKAGGEIGTLANAFRAMLTDLRDKQALVEFLGGQGAGEAKTVRMAAMTGTVASAAQQGGITPGQRFAVRYEVKEVLGVGGMGMVFKAVDSELGEVIAIKTLKQELLSEDTNALERFKSEIRLARRISHRNVVRTHDLGEFSGVYFITMEYVEGTTLKELVKRRGRLPIAATLTVAKQLCRALEVAHEQGVIHRDIKPQNMVVEPNGVLKVMDFGIARLAKRQSGMTEQGMVVGTPEYMAPEQLMGQDIDARADIYAAGCVIYECLTGAPPITAENQFTLVARLLEETPETPASRNPEVPQALSDLVMRVLAKKPEDRPQTALELHDLLAAIG
jgi:HAMP domain-containing protein/type II secretory pathway pseudopilin PulG/predicted Ser/Thr protein kinase